MKKIVFCTAAVLAIVAASGALAADLPGRRAAPAPQSYLSPAPAFTWTGFYVGVNGGADWGRFTKGGRTAFGTANGGLFGATAGYNYQVAPNFVLGVEGDYDWTNIDAKRSNAFSAISASRSRLTSVGTLRARAGYAADRALVYLTGGYAVGSLKSSLVDTTRALTGSDSSTRGGYVVGAGIEYAFTNNISAKAEYLYTKLGDKTMFPAPDTIRSGLNFSTVKAGLNYKF